MTSLCAIYVFSVLGYIYFVNATNKLEFGLRQRDTDKVITARKSTQHRQHVKGFPRFDVIQCFMERSTPKADFRNETSPTRGRISDYVHQLGRRMAKSDTMCRRRYRRHKHAKRNKATETVHKSDDVPAKVKLQTKYQHGYRFTNDLLIPDGRETCTVISNFLTNDTNLRFVRQKSKEMICNDGELHRKFHTLEHLGSVDFKDESHRSRTLKKWKHVACQLYQSFVDCLKEVSSADNYVLLPEDITHNADADNIDRSRMRFVPSSNREAVHVSDSSHVDFLNFMIGYDTEWTDDDQMWFY